MSNPTQENLQESSSTEQSANGSVQVETQGSSTLGAAVFNFANCIIGAGCIGLGGAIAISGGLVSIISIIFFGVLTKVSLDLLIDLTISTDLANNSFEDLGSAAFGKWGRIAVLVSKTAYSFGCLVAYLIVVKDNFGSGLRHLISGGETTDVAISSKLPGTSGGWFWALLQNEDLLTFLLSLLIVLPLCLLRDMSPLAKFSAVSVFSMVAIMAIIVSLFVINPGGDMRQTGGTAFENWFEVRSGIVESLGTFVFTFVSQHTVHLAYESLAPNIRTIETWRKVSLLSVSIAATVSLTIGVVVYATFWEKTESDIFQLYPDDIYSIDAAKILLCVTMLLTFPLPFFTCREMVILMVNDYGKESYSEVEEPEEGSGENNMRRSLLSEEFGNDLEDTIFSEATESSNHGQNHGHTSALTISWTVPGNERQLTLPFHFGVTFLLWLMVTVLAITSPSLGDVLDLVGCATGTVIAFVLPALFSFKLVGYSHLSAAILLVGGCVGLVGTYFSSVQLFTVDGR